MYTILYKKSVEKEIRNLPDVMRAAIVKKILALQHNPTPNGSIKLRGSDSLYRIRQGDYRVIYSIAGQELIVLVIKIAHRKEVYRSR